MVVSVLSLPSVTIICIRNQYMYVRNNTTLNFQISQNPRENPVYRRHRDLTVSLPGHPIPDLWVPLPYPWSLGPAPLSQVPGPHKHPTTEPGPQFSLSSYIERYGASNI